MTVRISHLVGGLIGILVLVGAAFSFGMQWGGNTEDSAEAAAAASALDGSEATTSEEFVEGDPEPELYDVVKVVDGDTIAISKGGKSETVRLIGIDTPETVDTRVEVQCFGKESSEKMKALLGGRKVRLETDQGEGERDKYKRLLAYVFREDGLFVNEYMIEQGFAYEYTYDSAYKYQKDFKAAEKAAEGAKRGLWAPDACPSAAAVPEVKGVTIVPQAVPAAQEPPKEEPKPEPKEEPKDEPESASAPSGSYTCSSNKYNCGDFSTHAEAQAVFDQCGGADNDVHKLDNNKDGEACESLP